LQKWRCIYKKPEDRKEKRREMGKVVLKGERNKKKARMNNKKQREIRSRKEEERQEAQNRQEE